MPEAIASNAAQERTQVPNHVSAALVMDFDVRTSPLFQVDPQAGMHSLQSHRPMFYTPMFGGHWVITDGAAAAEVFQNTEIFTAGTPLDGSTQGPIAIPMNLDPPDHTKYRKVLNDILTPRAAIAMEDGIRRLAIELIESVQHNGGCEFLREVAEPFPVTIFLRMADLPVERLSDFRQWAKAMFHDPSKERRDEAAMTIVSYLMEVVQERSKNPRSDILSSMIAATVDNRAMSPEELLSMIMNVFGGGLDTVLNALTFIMHFLAKNSAHRQQLIDNPALLPTALEELMRRHNLVSLFKAVRNDMEFYGVQLKKGDRVWCSTIMIAMDEKLMPTPLAVDFNRANLRNPIFGVGPHHCPGRHLGRLELRIFMEEWLARIPNFSIATDAPIPVLTGPSMGFASLPLKWSL